MGGRWQGERERERERESDGKGGAEEVREMGPDAPILSALSQRSDSQSCVHRIRHEAGRVRRVCERDTCKKIPSIQAEEYGHKESAFAQSIAHIHAHPQNDDNNPIKKYKKRRQSDDSKSSQENSFRCIRTRATCCAQGE